MMEGARGAAVLALRAWTAIALSVACTAGAFVSSPVPALASVAPAPLPNDRLHFGLSNQPSDLGWMTSSGVPWRYRYQYLSAGVNTGSGWETWNSPTGAFASMYMSASSASGYIPVFSYYELLQSNPSSGSNESDRDFSNLNNASTMAAYYANFKLLMQLAGAYGKAVVVQVEPDLWGYLQQRAAGGGSSTLTASVASSGFADVAGIPNTAQGFGYALLKLRDLYGPNVSMAIHASPWASGIDIASDTSASVGAGAEADKTAAFLNSAGIASNPYGSTWDLVFNDVDDHDAGWWEAQGDSSRWFDPTNTTFPNFTRYLTWVAELRTKTGRPQVVWQVPVGNQYYLTMNNTCGHYQDNLAAYFTSHANDLYSAGLIAVLFGAGNGCQTNNTDAQNDGITNNGGVPTTDAAGHCNACNTHTSTSSDDDGGFLRLAVGNYYQTGGGQTGVWTSLNGFFTSGPGASASGPTAADLFGRGGDRALWHASWNGTAWASWQSMGGIITAGPAAVSWGPNRIDVFVRGQDNGLYQSTWNGTAWTGWAALGGVITSGPAAASQGPNHLDVFARGSDNALYTRSWNGTFWTGWRSLGGIITSDPSAVSWGPGHIDVFARGMDNALWQLTFNGSSWGGWRSLGGVLHSAAASASCASGHLDVYVTGSDNRLYGSGWNGTGWSGWRSLGGTWSSSPAAVCIPGSNLVHVFARGASNNAMWEDVVPGS